jgi:putative flippase GtrA
MNGRRKKRVQKLVRYFAVIGIQLFGVCLFYYIFVELILGVKCTDVIPLIVVGAIGFIVGCIYYIKKDKKAISKNKKDRLDS